ncbi:MAG TPA: trehalose-6-phosphate synthase, partial [Acidimicrobiia bacterium]
MTVVLSNRGPYRYDEDPGGELVARPGAGGLASSLGPLLLSGAAGANGAWIAAALSDGDRAAVRAGAVHAPGVQLRLLDLDAHLFRLAYEVVSNGTLWFLYHGLFDLTRRPRFDRRWREAWEAYEAVNVAFTDATAELAREGDVVLVQDMHLALVPGMLRARRPDLRLTHFTHTPFCGPNSIRVLPGYAATALCESMTSVPCGFHARRWAQSYEASAREMLGDGTSAPTFVAALGPDPDALTQLAASDSAR